MVSILLRRSINSRLSAFSARSSPPSRSVGTFTWPISSKQLKIYFLASLDLIPVSASCSSGVCKIKQHKIVIDLKIKNYRRKKCFKIPWVSKMDKYCPCLCRRISWFSKRCSTCSRLAILAFDWCIWFDRILRNQDTRASPRRARPPRNPTTTCRSLRKMADLQVCNRVSFRQNSFRVRLF